MDNNRGFAYSISTRSDIYRRFADCTFLSDEVTFSYPRQGSVMEVLNAWPATYLLSQLTPDLYEVAPCKVYELRLAFPKD